MAFWIPLAAQVVGGLVGNLLGSGSRSSADDAMNRAMAELERIGMAPDESKRLVMEELQARGMYTPEIEEKLNP
jgi:hypothetical protein